MHKIRNCDPDDEGGLCGRLSHSSFFAEATYGFAALLGLDDERPRRRFERRRSLAATGINAAYSTTYTASIPGYSVSTVNLSAIPSTCLGKAYKIQLTGASGAAIGGEMTGTLPATATANIATSGAPDASLVTGVSVVVS